METSFNLFADPRRRPAAARGRTTTHETFRLEPPMPDRPSRLGAALAFLRSPRALRLSTAVFLVVAAGTILVPRATSYISTSAVVNAPTIRVASPFNGRVTKSPQMAALIRAGEPIAAVEPSVDQRQQRAELTAERDARLRQTAAYASQIAELERRLADERVRRDRQEALALRRQDARIADAEAALAQAQARSREIEARSGRSAALGQKGVASAAAQEADARDLIVSRQEVLRQSALRDGLRIEREGVAQGLLSGAEDGDAASRIHDIVMRLSDLVTERARVEAETQSLAARIASLEADRFAPVSPGNAVVQSLNARTGDDVHDGDELARLIDCDRRFLEVAISERHFESIAPGARATVQLRGGAETFEARVTAVRGAGARFDDPDLAAAPPQTPAGQLRVLLALEPADLSLPETRANFCDVGRTAEVRFDRSLIGDLRLFGFAFGRPRATELAVAAAAPLP